MKWYKGGTKGVKDKGEGSGDEGAEEGLSLSWKDILALSIAFFQVAFTKMVIVIASFALVIYFLGKVWLRCW